MFHSNGSWTKEKQELWKEITGTYEATTKTLCDLARKVRSEEEKKNSG
jgi:hypothetical protein